MAVISGLGVPIESTPSSSRDNLGQWLQDTGRPSRRDHLDTANHTCLVNLPEEVLLFLRQDQAGSLSQINEIGCAHQSPLDVNAQTGPGQPGHQSLR